MRHILRSGRRLVIVLIDLMIFSAAWYVSFALRLERFDLGIYAGRFLETLPAAVAFQFAGLYMASVYRGMWRYASVADLVKIIKGVFIGQGALIALIVLARGSQGFPRSVFLIDGALVVLLAGGARLVRRLQADGFFLARQQVVGRPVLVVGAGDAADDLIRELRQNPRLDLQPVGIVDDAPDKAGQELHGVKILGTVADLPTLVREKGIEEILIAIPSATGKEMRRIVESCRRAEVSYRTVPGVGDILDGRVRVQQLRQVRMEDLLRRDQIRLDREAIGRYISGRKILVTGAGGSIGSELCRQMTYFGPAELIFLDHSEHGLFYLDEEFGRKHPGTRRRSFVADVTHRCRMADIIGRCEPEVIFHAAAHKHVPLMEENLHAALLNNVTGTRVTAEVAAEAGVETFVMISTDKAVNPSSVMGMSKRIAELVVQAMDQRGGGTEFVSVRFGNVMGSEGSVIPFFRRQIERGGPVTVTHPEVVRYFMTIPEAAQLVLQAGAMGKGGEIFVLDMGEPILIADLAREMIRLSGLEPDADIEIRYVGLRPGEKLYEELITAGEGVVPTPHEKIMVLRSGTQVSADLLSRIRELEDMAYACAGPREVMAAVRVVVPEYRNDKR